MSEPMHSVLEVSQASFNDSVLLKSQEIPVLAEFTGVWSEPCIRMSDELVALAQEFSGRFVFAGIDVDEQPGLREQYGIVTSKVIPAGH